jgi:hypothetical protein
MQVELSKYTSRLLLILKEHLGSEDIDVIELAITSLYDQYVSEGKVENIHDNKPLSLMESLDSAGLLDRDFRCVINSSLEEYLITAKTEEEAWQQMAIKFPEEVESGFTVEEHEFKLNFGGD